MHGPFQMGVNQCHTQRFFLPSFSDTLKRFTNKQKGLLHVFICFVSLGDVHNIFIKIKIIQNKMQHLSH